MHAVVCHREVWLRRRLPLPLLVVVAQMGQESCRHSAHCPSQLLRLRLQLRVVELVLEVLLLLPSLRYLAVLVVTMRVQAQVVGMMMMIMMMMMILPLSMRVLWGQTKVVKDVLQLLVEVLRHSPRLLVQHPCLAWTHQQIHLVQRQTCRGLSQKVLR